MRAAFLCCMRILVADDDSIVRAVVQRVAFLSSYELLEAEDGSEAFRLIEEKDPDLLLTDLHMPVLDGFALVAAVRNSPRHRGMPIVCLSAENDREAITRLASLGITDYLLKPIRPRDLAERLASVIARSAKWKAARNTEHGGAVAPVVLVIHPDPGVRSMIATSLAPDYDVLEAISGPNAVTLFRSQTPRLVAVLVGDGLEVLDEERVVRVLRQLMTEQGTPVAPMVLISSTGEVTSEKRAAFDGVVTRPAAAEDLLAGIAQWLPKEASCPTT